MNDYTLLIPVVLLGAFWVTRRSLTESFQQAVSGFVRWLVQHISDSVVGSALVGLLLTLSTFSRSQTKLMIFGFVNSGVISENQTKSLIIGSSFGGMLLLWTYLIYGIMPGLIFASIGIAGIIFLSERKHQVYFLSLFYFGFLLILLYYLLEPGIFAEFFTPISHPAVLILIVFGLSAFTKSEQLGLFFCVAALASTVVNEVTVFFGVFAVHIGALVPQLWKIRKSRRVTLRAYAFNLFTILFGFGVVTVLFATGYFQHYFIEIANFLEKNPSTTTRPLMFVALIEALAFFVPGIVLLILRPMISRVLIKIIPDREKKQVQKLENFGNPGDLPPSLSTELVNQEIVKMAAMVHRVLELAQESLLSGPLNDEIFKKIEKYESITDNVKTEVDLFARGVLEQPVHPSQSRSLTASIRMADELESLGDLCRHLVRTKQLMQESSIEFDEHWNRDIHQIMDHLVQSYELVFTAMTEKQEIDISQFQSHFRSLRKTLEGVRKNWFIRYFDSSASEEKVEILWRAGHSFRLISEHTINLYETWLGHKINLAD